MTCCCVYFETPGGALKKYLCLSWAHASGAATRLPTNISAMITGTRLRLGRFLAFPPFAPGDWRGFAPRGYFFRSGPHRPPRPPSFFSGGGGPPPRLNFVGA